MLTHRWINSRAVAVGAGDFAVRYGAAFGAARFFARRLLKTEINVPKSVHANGLVETRVVTGLTRKRTFQSARVAATPETEAD